MTKPDNCDCPSWMREELFVSAQDVEVLWFLCDILFHFASWQRITKTFKNAKRFLRVRFSFWKLLLINSECIKVWHYIGSHLKNRKPVVYNCTCMWWQYLKGTRWLIMFTFWRQKNWINIVNNWQIHHSNRQTLIFALREININI